MKLHSTMLLCGAALFLFALPAFSQNTPAMTGIASGKPPAGIGKGIFIEALKKNSDAERAGLHEGDILLRWSRADANGEIESPFDLSWIEIEQAPRGTVTLEGLRGQEKKRWELGQALWGIDVRPNLTGSLLSVYSEGQKLAAEGKTLDAAERWRSAAGKVQEVQSAWLGSWFLFHAGQMFAGARQWKEADSSFQEAIEESAEQSTIKVQLLRAWAATFQQRADWGNAKKYYQAAADASPKPNSENLLFADILDGAGLAAWQHGDLVEAERNYSRASEIQQKLAPGSLAMAKSLHGLGVLAWSRGDEVKAENYHSDVLRIREKLAPGSLDVAASLNNLGVLAMDRGDLSKADELYLQALTIKEKLIPGGMEVASTLSNLGILAQERGDLSEARDYDQRALAIQEKLAPGSLNVARTLNNLGIVVDEQGDSAVGEDCLHRALAIRERLAPDGLELAETLNNLGMLNRKRGDLAKAEEYMSHALSLKEKIAPGGLYVATGLNELGGLAEDRGDLVKAEEYYRQSLPIWEALAPEKKGFAETLASLASVSLRRGQLDAAAPVFDRALSVLESQISHLGGSEDVRAGFRASHLSYYQDYIDLLVRKKQPELALQVLERSRAQTLLEMLAHAHVDVGRGLDAALLEREHSLQADIRAKVDRRIRLQSGNHTEEQVTAINREITALLAQQNEVEGQIRVNSPGYAALTQPQSLSAKEIQRQLLDVGTVLLEYSLGEERSYVFALTATSLDAYELPKRAEIEAAARQIYEQLTTRSRQIKGKPESEFLEATAALSRMILAPVAAQIKGKRLLMVSDGALQYIPFAVLPEPGAQDPDNASAKVQPLLVEHEIVNLPSASVLAVLRSERIGRQEATKAVAVLADPVFAQNDGRVRAANTVHAHSRGIARGLEDNKKEETSAFASLPRARLTRSMADVGLSPDGMYLPRLRFTRREAEAIMAVTPATAGMKALDFDASRATATSPELAQYRVVHFATHGLLDSQHPELSGLVLSLVDENGKQQNGFLDLEDIYNLNLPVELVVLSACETGLGKEIQGEGLVGLTRGFMYAGASRVLASLWKVDDVATAELMGRFYASMEKDGLPPAAALRKAQIEMWKQKDWNSPYYWAAFQLQGEWK